MKWRLLELVVCPRCHGALDLEVFEEAAGASGPSRRPVEVLEGRVRCTRCGAAYPVIEGIPRLLDAPLLARMRRRFPEFFGKHPEFIGDGTDADGELADTLESFTRQRLDLKPPGPAAAEQWRDNLRRNLGDAMRLEELGNKVVLDVGCGFGRHMYVAAEAGAEVVGVDLSGGVDLARLNNLKHPRCHVVQANVMDRPFRESSFDVVWSFGVLHHMPDPQAGFRAIVPFARRDGGLVVIWVYGYRGMAFTYKLSHMRPLHYLTRRMSSMARVRASKAVAALLSALYWEPLRIAQRAGLKRQVDRLPLAAYVEHEWLARVAAVHDRLSTPITHFHDRSELEEWLKNARLANARVEDTNRRGWRAHGWRAEGGVARSAPT